MRLRILRSRPDDSPALSKWVAQLAAKVDVLESRLNAVQYGSKGQDQNLIEAARNLESAGAQLRNSAYHR